ncbi:MFS transporter [Gluconobacter morbifer]|uniref:Metabolite transport protein n=1 Tax=Gluconobacter morbifer G707 TaxID=1088869 RepID=G6XKM0_9PROT|nr:MFS transporter [Gluconobacter morbifer]EHH67816.1 metabolite transport protein [Gluconobacter morbifer G707]
MTIAARIERLPFTAFHWKLLLLGGLGYTFDGLDSAIVAFTLPMLKTQWHLTGPELGTLGSATYLGYGLGALLAGWLGDRAGRRYVMMSALIVYAIGSLLSAQASSFGGFYIFRLIAGLGAGAEGTIIAPYLSEFVGNRYRGAFTAALTGFYSFGYVTAAILGFLLIPASPDGWRWALACTGLPILMLLWWRRALPESPRWLARRGQTAKASLIVGQMERHAGLEPGSVPPGTCEIAPAPPLKTLFEPPMRRTTFMSWIMWLAITFSFYAFFTWIPSLMIARGMTITRSFGYAISIYAAQLPGYMAAALLTERIGRRTTVALFMVLGGISAIGMTASQTPAQILASGILMSFFMNGTYGGIYAYTPELFPTSLRARGMGLAAAISRLGALSAPILIGWLYPATGFPGVFGLTTAVLLAGAAVTLIFGPKTEKRPLDDEPALSVPVS